MRKLKLDIGDLTVEGFETILPMDGQGTVHGAESRDPCPAPLTEPLPDTSDQVCTDAVACMYSWDCTAPTCWPDAAGQCTFPDCGG